MEFLRWLLPYFPEKYRQSDSRFSDKWKERVECCKKTEIKNSDNYELSLTLVLKNLDLTYKGEHRVCMLLFPLKGSHLRKQAIFIF